MKPVEKWPRFEPMDPNATCRICKRSWQRHGLDMNHCDWCGEKLNDYTFEVKTCFLVANHEGDHDFE